MRACARERLGLFSETGYISLGDRYPKQDPKSKVFHESAFKGKQMLPGGSKTRSALQAGYFSGTFQRVMEGESYTDSIKNRRRDRTSQFFKNTSFEKQKFRKIFRPFKKTGV